MADSKTVAETDRKPESTDTPPALAKEGAAAAAPEPASRVGESKRPVGRAKDRKAIVAKAKAPAKTPAMTVPDFVRALPANTSFADAAKGAAKLGMKLSQSYFYLLRSANRKQTPKTKVLGRPNPAAQKASAKPAPKSKPAATAGRAGLRLVSDHPDEQFLINAVRAVGAARARELLNSVETFERN